jgi:hypothetical protein
MVNEFAPEEVGVLKYGSSSGRVFGDCEGVSPVARVVTLPLQQAGL